MTDAPVGVHLSTRAARRIALAAQGFSRPRPPLAGTRDLQRVIDRVLSLPGINRSTTVIALAEQVAHRVLPLALRAAVGR